MSKNTKYKLISGVIVAVAVAGTLVYNHESKTGNTLTLTGKYQQAEISQKYDLNQGTLKRRNRGINDVQVTIGEKSRLRGRQKQIQSNKQIQPNIELIKWDETRFKLKPNRTPQKTSFNKDKLMIKTQDMDFEIYETEKQMKYIWYLKEKPKDNTLTFDIETSGLDFFYQPPLDVEMASSTCTATDCGGSHRPIDVVGSYAVFHKTKSGNNTKSEKNYKVGKAFHIYRPKLIDAEGKETWGNLHIDKDAGTYEVTIPQEFLDKAIYPIKSNDTFGYTTAGSTWHSGTVDRITGSVFTLTEDGDATELTAYNDGSRSSSARFAIYKHSDLGYIDETSEGNWSSTGWSSLSFPSAVSLTGSTDYVLVAWATQTQPGTPDFAYDSGSTDQGHYDSETYNGFPDPLVPTHEDRKYSIYATYTPAAPPPAEEPQPPQIIIFD